MTAHQASFSERQNKVILRMLDEGIPGFTGGLSASNYMAITQAPTTTTTRDLNRFIEMEVLSKTEGA